MKLTLLLDLDDTLLVNDMELFYQPISIGWLLIWVRMPRLSSSSPN